MNNAATPNTQTNDSTTMSTIEWAEGGTQFSAQWRSENGAAPPKRLRVITKEMTAEEAHQLASEGTALLWQGDYHLARQLLLAIAKRIDQSHKYAVKKRTKKAIKAAEKNVEPHTEKTLTALQIEKAQAFHLHRQAQAQRARTLSLLLVPLTADYRIPLKRAPNVELACNEAYGAAGTENSVVPLREILGLIGAHEWRKNGLAVPALGTNIYPHYGVFAPIRNEYLSLIKTAPLPAALKTYSLALDIGTGTGVLAAILSQRGVQRVIATDQDARALSCARDNMAQLGLTKKVQIVEADLFPTLVLNDAKARASLIICNPPWIPARPSAPIEHAIYDPDSRMLQDFLSGLKNHLGTNGEGWLVLSDIAEHLGLRTRETLLGWIDAAGLKVIDRSETKPTHPRAADETDPLHTARAAEITSLWRLMVK